MNETCKQTLLHVLRYIYIFISLQGFTRRNVQFHLQNVEKASKKRKCFLMELSRSLLGNEELEEALSGTGAARIKALMFCKQHVMWLSKEILTTACTWPMIVRKRDGIYGTQRQPNVGSKGLCLWILWYLIGTIVIEQ